MRRDVAMENNDLNVYEMNAAQDENNPTIPLPNPGEGGPAYSGNSNNIQDNVDMPTIPLPNPGEGGPVYSENINNNFNNLLPNIIGTIISTYPRPNEPCRFCGSNSTRIGYVRFLNAATGYNPFTVFVNENMFSNSLNFAEITDYERVAAGNQIVTVMGENGYIYIQKRISVNLNMYTTIAIINTDGGLDLQLIDDSGCERGTNMACIRAANLSYNSGSLSVIIGNQYVSFPNLRYQSVADFESIRAGIYVYTVSKNMTARLVGMGTNILFSAPLVVQSNRNYTIYLLSWQRDSTNAVKALIVEDM